ncbi:Amastin surface glycoprotein [Trypanosoma melophagium]|uniref:Amastin surface glycoprotein n=1 Tax=Trypanosoma melophagium TaxID=715481 RepID=UPI00351A9544|nr:Amastin surface glycoprotein [Trypanosoma melophagium]
MPFRLRFVAVLVPFIASFVSIIIGFSCTLFESPLIYGENIAGSRIKKLQLLDFPVFDVDIPIDGANFTWKISLDFFHYYYNLTLALPYGFAPQHVFEKYNFNDVPCTEFRSNMKLGQVFSLLAIFACLFTIVFVTAAIFTRAMLPFVWIFGWITIICNSIALSTLVKVYLNGFCTDDSDDYIPPGIQYSMPSGGVVMYAFSAIMLTAAIILTSFL